jgi:hypothetical protein
MSQDLSIDTVRDLMCFENPSLTPEEAAFILSTRFPECSYEVSGFPTKAVELLTVDTNEVTEIRVPPENGTKDFVEFWEIHLIRDRDQTDYHRIYLA